MFTPVPDRRRLLAQLSKSPQRYRRKKGDAPRQRGRKRNRDARNLMFDGWERQDFAQVGDWSIEQAMALPHFIRDRNGRPYSRRARHQGAAGQG